ncbi:MAG: hypothetical protein WC959_06345 [Kiritimatiellales bacterium]
MTRIINIINKLAIFGLLLSYYSVHGATYEWQGGSYHSITYTNVFSSTDYWNPSGIPGASDNLRFRGSVAGGLNNKTLGIQLEKSVTVNIFYMEYGDVNLVFDLNGYDFFTTGQLALQNNVGSQVNGSRLKIVNGNDGASAWNMQAFNIGAVSGSIMTVEIAGSNLTVAARNTSVGRNDGNSKGILHISDGAILNLGTTSDLSVNGMGSMLILDDATINARSLSLGSGTTLGFVLTDTQPDPLVTISSSVLVDASSMLNFELDPNSTFQENDFISLINYDGGVWTGEFSGYNDGHMFSLDGYEFRVDYAGGTDGKTFGLTVIPEPSAVSLFLISGISGVILFFIRNQTK